jgi:GT2 family glycosyltransferase
VLSFVIPTRDRPRELAITLDAVARQPRAHTGPGAEVIVVDNASDPPVRAPRRLANGLPVTILREHQNLGAAARNVAAAVARGRWLVMLDDDSAPLDAPFTSVLPALDDDVAAVGGEIMLPTGRREAGGLPEVVVGCGCVVRRDAFLAAGGYDPAFGYYVEEYDLCARLIAAGHRIAHTRELPFLHRKTGSGRSFASILYKLVRNSGWTIRRSAPDDRHDAAQAGMRERYRAIATREGVADAFHRAVEELDRTIGDQPRRPLSAAQWERFVGAHAVRSSLVPELRAAGIDAVRIVERGKGAEVIDRVLHESGVRVADDAPVAVIGTLSPGPMRDGVERHAGRAMCAWRPDSARARSAPAGPVAPAFLSPRAPAPRGRYASGR